MITGKVYSGKLAYEAYEMSPCAAQPVPENYTEQKEGGRALVTCTNK